MVFIHDDDDDADRLRSALEERLELLGRARAIALAERGRLAGEHAALGYHPNYLGYLYGGDFASRGMGAAHILPLIADCIGGRSRRQSTDWRRPVLATLAMAICSSIYASLASVTRRSKRPGSYGSTSSGC